MIGKLIGTVVLLFLVAFAVGTGAAIIKELISRKRAARMKDKKNTDEKEDDERKD